MADQMPDKGQQHPNPDKTMKHRYPAREPAPPRPDTTPAPAPYDPAEEVRRREQRRS